jgi:hypothetical protein
MIGMNNNYIELFNLIRSMKKLMIYVLLMFLGLFSFRVSADIVISIRNFETVPAQAPRTEPIISCEILAYLEGTLIELSADNVDIIQAGVAFIRNIEVGIPDIEGWQKMVWGLELGIPHNVTFEIVVSHNGEIGYRDLPPLIGFPGYDVDIAWEFTGQGKINPPISLSTENSKVIVSGDGKKLVQFYFRVRGNYDSTLSFTPAPYLDSITFTNPNISYIWSGLLPDITGRPPKKLLLDNFYLITLTYDEPPDSPFIRDWMIFHFSGDIQYKIELVCHPYWLDYKPLMKLEYPLGGEKFAPCEKVMIKWSGHNPEHQVNLQFSSNNKRNWINITNVSGNNTSYLWEVPNAISDSCYIRVSQNFTQKGNKLLVYDSARIISAEFNSLSTKVLTTSNIGNVVEWDLFGGASVLTSLSFMDDYGEGNDEINSAIYLTDSTFVVLDSKNKKLYYVNSGTSLVDNEVLLTSMTNSSLGSLLKDFNDRFILIKPNKHYGKIATFIDIYGNYIATLEENIPITNMVLSESEDKLYYSLLDNTIKSVDLSVFPVIVISEEYDFAKKFNIIETMSVSKDGEQIAVGIRNIKPTGSREFFGDNMIYDKPTGKVFQNIQVHRRNSVSIDFSPSGNLLIIGNPTIPQICIEDLTGGSNAVQIPQVFADTLLGLTVSSSGNGLVAYSEGNINCMYISFALPEQVENLIPFSIQKPLVVLSDSSLSKMKDLLIGTSDSITFTLQLCNIGNIISVFETGYFWNTNPHFNLDYSKTTFPLVLEPGECVDFSIIISPQDTGLLSNILRFVACGTNYEFPFSFRSINRKLTNLVSDTIDFGEVCLLEKDTMKLELFRNDDSIDVVINEIYIDDANFVVSHYSRDTVLHPGEKYYVEIYYRPQTMGEHTGKLHIIYCGQRNVIKHFYCKGRGIGTFLDVSHYYLPFIYEIEERKVLVTNTGNTILYIDSVLFEPSGYYTCLTALPMNIGIGESVELVVKYNQADNIVPADMQILAKPCAKSQIIKLVPYVGTAALTIPLVETEPQNTNCYIPVMLEQTENYSYSGERFLDFTISINPTLFKSNYGISNYGNVKIKSDNVISGRRIIEVRFTGNITGNKIELLRLYGIAALGNMDTSVISFEKNSLFFGKNVETTAKDGLFKLTGLCDGRFLMTEGAGLISFNSVTPIPSTGIINVEYEVIGSTIKNAYIGLYEISGTLLFQKEILSDIGKHNITLDLSDYSSGVYYVIISYGEDKTDPAKISRPVIKQ